MMKRPGLNLNPRRSAAPKGDGVTFLLKRKLQHPASEQIRKRAHEIFLARGGVPGRELDDWLQAERELKAGMGQGSEAQGQESQSCLRPIQTG